MIILVLFSAGAGKPFKWQHNAEHLASFTFYPCFTPQAHCLHYRNGLPIRQPFFSSVLPIPSAWLCLAKRICLVIIQSYEYGITPLRKENHFRLPERSKHQAVAVSWRCSPFHILPTVPENYKMSPLSCSLNVPTTVTVFLFGQQQVLVEKMKTSYADKSRFTLHNSSFNVPVGKANLTSLSVTWKSWTTLSWVHRN